MITKEFARKLELINKACTHSKKSPFITIKKSEGVLDVCAESLTLSDSLGACRTAYFEMEDGGNLKSGFYTILDI